MKKIKALSLACLLTISLVGCSGKEITKNESEVGSQESSATSEVISETSQEAEVSVKETESKDQKSDLIGDSSITNTSNIDDVDSYVGLIGLTEAELIEAVGAEPKGADEGGLNFADLKITVWFNEDDNTVNEIFVYNEDADFNGLKIGNTIEEFKAKFGEPISESSRIMDFEYNGVILYVYYDESTGKVFGIYVTNFIWCDEEGNL